MFPDDLEISPVGLLKRSRLERLSDLFPLSPYHGPPSHPRGVEVLMCDMSSIFLSPDLFPLSPGIGARFGGRGDDGVGTENTKPFLCRIFGFVSIYTERLKT